MNILENIETWVNSRDELIEYLIHVIGQYEVLIPYSHSKSCKWWTREEDSAPVCTCGALQQNGIRKVLEKQTETWLQRAKTDNIYPIESSE